jgi:transcriptional regulator with XRE-family HTH domain
VPKQATLTPFGSLVDRYRRQRGLSQKALADAVGYSTVHVWRQLTGQAIVTDPDRELYRSKLSIPKSEMTAFEGSPTSEVSEPRPLSYANLPVHLMRIASSFELEALEMGADEAMMRYVAQALRSPESVTMFRMGYDGKESSPEEQVKFMESHIAKLRALVKERVKRNRSK